MIAKFVAFCFILVDGATGQIPNVYEFCSALMSAPSPSAPPSACKQCQGRPGKIGPPGIRGPLGLKGDRGEQGTCEGLMEQEARFEGEIRRKLNLVPKLQYCSFGMKSGDIPDEYITASTSNGFAFQPFNGRLDARVMWTASNSVVNIGAWCPSSANGGDWIQVDLGKSQSVAGVVTQGRAKNHWGNQNWVKTFKMSCGQDQRHLHFVLADDGSEKIFAGNSDRDTKVINRFPTPMTCRIVRLFPLSWNTNSPWVRPCMRMEIIRGECFDMF